MLNPFFARTLRAVVRNTLAHLRKDPLVKHWEGGTIILDVTRRVPEGDKKYER